MRNKKRLTAAEYHKFNEQTGADGKKRHVHHESEAWWQIRRGELQHIDDSVHRRLKRSKTKTMCDNAGLGITSNFGLIVMWCSRWN